MRLVVTRIGALLLLAGSLLAAARETSSPNSETVTDLPPTITSVAEYWALSNVGGDQEYPLHAEIEVHYYDADWSVMWADWGGTGVYLDPGKQPLPIASGQRVELKGFVSPRRQQIIWERTAVRVLNDSVVLDPVPLPDPLIRPADLNLRLVTVEGLISEQSEIDSTHRRFVIVSPTWTIVAQMHVEVNRPIPQLRGAFVRLQGVFSVKEETSRTDPILEMWIARPEHLQVISWLAHDARFTAPRTRIEDLAEAPKRALVRVEGSVHAQEPGISLTLRDDTGQVRLLTQQTEEMAPGQSIEAIGYPEIEGVESRLRQSVFRVRATESEPKPEANSPVMVLAKLRLTEQIRQLEPSQAGRGFPVDIRGVVTWSDPATHSFFLQDSSGGIKVTLPGDGSIALPKFAMDVVVQGETQVGDFVPIVRAVSLIGGPGRALSAARPVTFAQAMTGTEYGAWSEVRGYVRSVTWEENELARVELTTSGGELVARVRGLNRDHGLNGALVDVRAVCDTIVNDRRQLIGVQLWVASPELIRVREPAPADLFATPTRSIGSLLQFSAARELNPRVQISGRVVLHRVGCFFYIEDGEDRLLVLSRQPEPLQPGDQVAVVGFAGHEAGRLIMRDAVYRRTAAGPAPEPRPLEDVASASIDLDGATVSVLGRLLDQTATPMGTRLQLQRDKVIFEANWIGELTEAPAAGSLLEVIGVYRVQFDEYRQPRGFAIDLRSPADVRVVSHPPRWTVTRVFWAGGTLLVAVLLTAGWALSLSRKNQLLREADRELHQANLELESRVVTRTRDLQLEVAQRQSSEEALAQERKLLRTLIDSLPVYLYVKNATGRFVIGNLPHARLFGADSGFDIVGKTDFDIHPAELAQRYHNDDQRVLQNGDPLLLHEEPGSVHGEPRWFSTTKVPFRDRRGEIIGLIGISQDITERKNAESQHEILNRQLLESSRRAGMAEVATGILHNVGNVLNSVNVSATLAVEHVRQSKVDAVAKLAELLKAHADDLPAFFAGDARGSKIPDFVASLSRELTAEQARVLEELEHLWKKIEHIKDIISMQQSYAKVSGAVEVLELAALIDDAVRMNASSLTRHGIKVVLDFQARPTAHTERHRIVQILVNLIKNAKQACHARDQTGKRITLRLTQNNEYAQISVSDNGVGIAPENLTRIFGHGFTTKKDGHGFGLHSSSLTARELGGSLTAHSDGPGLGATFTLELPLARPA